MSNPDGPLTYCPHQFHCRECEERIANIVRSWAAKVEALERKIAETTAALKYYEDRFARPIGEP